MSVIVAANVHSGTAPLRLSEAEHQGLAQGSVPARLDAGGATLAESAYVSGLHAAFLVAAAVAAVVALVSLVTLRGTRRATVEQVRTETVVGEAGHA